MPYMIRKEPCKKCGEPDKLTRNKWHNKNQKWYLQTTCKECEGQRTKEHQQNNREYWRKLNKRSYKNWSDSFRRKRNLLSLQRHKRTKQASRHDELTSFVFEEAYLLCRMRENLLILNGM